MARFLKSALLALIAGLCLAALAGPASAQTTLCPAGGPGGAGGDGGITAPGDGGLAFTVPGLFATGGNALAPGGDALSARGGDAGRGGSGSLPICNQNTNGAGAAAAPAVRAAAPAPGAGGAAAGVARPVGGGIQLARTGQTRLSTEMALAGSALTLGGLLLFLGLPARRSSAS